MLDKTQVDEVGQVLLDAADYIEEYGWCQGSYIGNIGEVCLVGSLYASIDYNKFDKNFTIAIRRLYNYLNIDDLLAWNDHPDRTKEEVIEALRMAAYL